jgi:hypothetical protein
MMTSMSRRSRRLIAPWPQPASELYRPSDRLLSAKLVPTFADRGMPRGQRDGSLQPHSRISRPDFLLHNINSVRTSQEAQYISVV